jgi:hypothetical protein
MLRAGRLSKAEATARSQAGSVCARGCRQPQSRCRALGPNVPNTCRDGGLQMLRCRSGHGRDRSVTPLSWTNPQSSSLIPLPPVSWQTSVAHHPTEDSTSPPLHRLRCRIEPYLDQGGACGAAGPAPASASGLGGPGRRVPGHAMQVTIDQSGSPGDATGAGLCRLPGDPLSRSRLWRLGRSLRSRRMRSASPNPDTAPARQGSAPAGKTERTENPKPLLLHRPHEEPRAMGVPGERRSCV